MTIYKQQGVLSDVDDVVGLRWGTVPPDILVNPALLTTLPSTFTTDSNSIASLLNWVMPSSSIELHWRTILLVILLDPRLSTAFKQDSCSVASCLTLSEAIKLN
jgi:hypothetical protein